MIGTRRIFRMVMGLTCIVVGVCVCAAGGEPADEIFADGFEQGDASAWTAGPIDRVRAFYSGHSLVNLDLPKMIEQLATGLGNDHLYNLQMGLGSNMSWRLQTHEDGQNRDGTAPLGFSILSEIPDAQTIGGAKYDSLVVTEAVPIFDHFIYSQSISNARIFYDLIMTSPAGWRAILYEVWPEVVGGDFAGWAAQVAAERVIWDCIVSIVNDDPRAVDRPMQLLPGGEALARLVSEIEAGSVPGLSTASEVFADDVHLNNLGNYYMALVHAAVLYRKSPVGAPTALEDPWGTVYPGMPSTETAAAMAEIAWDVASNHALLPVPTYDVDTCYNLTSPFCDGNAYCEGLLRDEVLIQ